MKPRFTTSVDPRLPLLAIDLGYSANNTSCGFANSHSSVTMNYQFGASIEATLDLFHAKGPHVLILEAVLSTYHRPDGNPDIRGSFEKGRGWYYGPGVSTYAGALRFIKELDRRLPVAMRPIPIVEGFLSYKKARTDHSDDARRLVDEFNTATRYEPIAGSEPILSSIDRAPMILKYNE